MSRIIVPANTLVGRELLSLTNQIIACSQIALRLQATKNAIIGGGSATLLESSVESQMPAGTGATISTGIDSIVTSLNGLASLVATIDQG